MARKRYKRPKLLHKLGLTKGKIADYMAIVKMHREILHDQGLHPDQVAGRKNFHLTAKYNKLGYDMLEHYDTKPSEHNRQIVKCNEALIDYLELDSLRRGIELRREEGGKRAKTREYLKAKSDFDNARDRSRLRKGIGTSQDNKKKTIRTDERDNNRQAD